MRHSKNSVSLSLLLHSISVSAPLSDLAPSPFRRTHSLSSALSFFVAVSPPSRSVSVSAPVSHSPSLSPSASSSPSPSASPSPSPSPSQQTAGMKCRNEIFRTYLCWGGRVKALFTIVPCMAAVPAQLPDEFGPGPINDSVLSFQCMVMRISWVKLDWLTDPGPLKCRGRNDEFRKRRRIVVDDRIVDIVKRVGLEGLYRTPGREIDHNLITAFIEKD
uniref:Uncharacterized protein n=1 Tax=Quercus lobata TaxID=97700 RepID=A0A7N2RE18_QUELO